MRGIARIYKVTLLVLFNTASLLPGLIIAALPKKNISVRAATSCMSIWARCTCSILGIRIRKTGLQKVPAGSFIVANHCSYLDILVLGSLIPGVFVAKQEIASWPLLGWLSRFAGTIFVDRRSRMSALTTFSAIESRLTSDISVLLFPEGTTNNGTDILDFKSSFFKIPVEKNRPVQPVSLMYSHINGEPVGEGERDRIAWYGSMNLLPHLWNILGMQSIDVSVRFNPVIQNVMTPDLAQTRKLVSAIAHESIRAGYESLLAEVA